MAVFLSLEIPLMSILKFIVVCCWRDIMDEEIAWANFVKTGSISDYLIYSRLKNKHELGPQEETINETEYGRSNLKGNEYF